MASSIVYHAYMKTQMTWAEEINSKADSALAQRGLAHMPARHSMMVQHIENLRRAALAPHKPRHGANKIQAHRCLCALAGVSVSSSMHGLAAEFLPELCVEGHWEHCVDPATGFDTQRFIRG